MSYFKRTEELLRCIVNLIYWYLFLVPEFRGYSQDEYVDEEFGQDNILYQPSEEYYNTNRAIELYNIESGIYRDSPRLSEEVPESYQEDSHYSNEGGQRESGSDSSYEAVDSLEYKLRAIEDGASGSIPRASSSLPASNRQSIKHSLSSPPIDETEIYEGDEPKDVVPNVVTENRPSKLEDINSAIKTLKVELSVYSMRVRGCV